MANKLEVIWTALPNGFVKGSSSLLKLSLVATFRLTTDQTQVPREFTLADFIRDWDRDNWTRTVEKYEFRIDFGTGEKPVKPTNDFDFKMWDALFGNPRSVRVKPYQVPATDGNALSKAEIFTYGTKDLNDTVETAYVELANNMTRLSSEQPRQAMLTRGDSRARIKAAHATINGLVEKLNVYMPADPTEKERLEVLKELDWLDQDITNNAGLNKPKALAYRDLFLERISRNGGRDLRRETVIDVHQRIIDKNLGLIGPAARPTDVILFRAHAQPSAQPQSGKEVSTDFAIFHSPLPESHSIKSMQGILNSNRVFDFHEMLTMVGSYPVLMRRLGLVIDVEIDRGEITRDGFVRVTWAGEKSENPRTAYICERPKFLPKPKTARIKEGLLDLNNGGHFSIQGMDVEGVLMKHLANVSNARRDDPDASKNLFEHVTEQELPPTLRTLGISVLFSDFEKFIRELLENAEKNTCKPGDCVFHAEDLIKGLRVDIFEADSGKWYSLCERAERYQFLTADNKELFYWPASGTYPSEGAVHLTLTKPEVTQSVEAANLKVFQQHQSLFRWENWSLLVRFPQLALDVKRNDPKPENAPLRLRPEFEVVDKSLPKLRFGKEYRVRCRVVDPAGNSLGKDDIGSDDFAATLPTGRFARYESVAPPELLVRAAINPKKTPGDQLNRLVVRDGAGSSLRCAAPPRVTAMTAIVAGKYDDGVSPQESAFEGAFLEEHGEFRRVKADDPAYETPIFTYEPGNAEPPRQPYLPDPFAVAACVAMGTIDDQELVPDVLQNELLCGFYNSQESWPKAQPFLINLVPADPKQQQGSRS